MDFSEKAKILIVDDVPDKRLAVEVILQELDQTVVAVGSGEEALRRLLTEDFAVILLDVNMPEMDGFETAELIRKRRRSEHTPIIFLTAFPDDTYAEKGYSLRAVDYILTPVVPSVLRTKVGVFVEAFKMAQQVKRQAEERVALAHEHAARLAAEQANRTKNEFLANVSHELRTPMNAIIGMTDLALKEPLTPIVREYLTTVRTSSHTLLELLNEILDISKVEAGKFTLQSTGFKLREMLDELSSNYRFRAADKGIQLTSRIGPDVPDELYGDSLRLRQVLGNLLSNALKFTDHGRIGMEVAMAVGGNVEGAMHGAGSVPLQFSVTDTGIGISPTDQQRIFAPFAQVDASSTRRHGGIGLGLAIASDLIRAMHGKLNVHSEMGVGSTFSFAIPLQTMATDLGEHRSDRGVPKKQSAELQSVARTGAEENGAVADGSNLANGSANDSGTDAAGNEQPEKLRVLLAEDTRANQMLVMYALRQRGHEVDIAGDGREAVDRAAGSSYDIILMDVQMPELDGFQATAAIRALPACATVPIIALTAHAMTGDRDRCLAAGMNGYLPKPLDIVRLVEVVEDFGQQNAKDGCCTPQT
ncbi:MAG TPA: response regulator [Pirellulales bacterium]|jgi:signal transduction histidine kinase